MEIRGVLDYYEEGKFDPLCCSCGADFEPGDTVATVNDDESRTFHACFPFWQSFVSSGSEVGIIIEDRR